MAKKLWLRYILGALTVACCGTAYFYCGDFNLKSLWSSSSILLDVSERRARTSYTKQGTNDVVANGSNGDSSSPAPSQDGPDEAEDAFLQRMAALQRVRQERLRTACNSSHLKVGSMGTVFNLESLGLTYCCIAKCASTTFKTFLDRVTGRECVKKEIHSCTASAFPRAASPAAFLPSSVVIVRDPWERLVSAYTNKFVEERNAIAGPCYRQHDKELHGAAPLTFTEFVECLVSRVDRRRKLNGHVAPISWHCSPCRNKFTYIATLETFADDLNYLIKAVLPRTKTPEEYWKAISSVKRRKSEKSNKTQLTYNKNYGSLSSQLLERIVHIYEPDALLYGYPAHPLDP